MAGERIISGYIKNIIVAFFDYVQSKKAKTPAENPLSRLTFGFPRDTIKVYVRIGL